MVTGVQTCALPISRFLCRHDGIVKFPGVVGIAVGDHHDDLARRPGPGELLHGVLHRVAAQGAAIGNDSDARRHPVVPAEDLHDIVVEKADDLHEQAADPPQAVHHGVQRLGRHQVLVVQVHAAAHVDGDDDLRVQMPLLHVFVEELRVAGVELVQRIGVQPADPAQ